jgi:ABC-type sulfate/molybdate transport systems ATPase subunit
MLDCDVDIRRREFTVRAALQVGPGECVALFGPSGAGKTSVIEAIAGLVAVERGRIVLDGRTLTVGGGGPAVPVHLRRVGLVRQHPALFPHLTVRENLLFGAAAGGTGVGAPAGGWSPRDGGHGPGGRGSGRAEESPAFRRLTERLGLAGLLAAHPHALSGGQRQRVAFARTLLSDFRVLLLDEPYTGLDAALRAILAAVVADTVAERRVPAVLVTHDLAEAQEFADRLVVLDHGRVLQQGAPDQVVSRPASRRVAELLGYRAFVPGALAGLPRGVWVGVRPDRVQSGRHPALGPVVTGLVRRVRPHGGQWQLTLRLEGPADGGTAEDGGSEPGEGEAIPGEGGRRAPVVVAMLPAPQAVGARLSLTLVHPPVFGPDGEAVEPPGQACGG